MHIIDITGMAAPQPHTTHVGRRILRWAGASDWECSSP